MTFYLVGAILNTNMYTKLFQFDTIVNTSLEEASNSKVKNMKDLMVVKASQDNLYNKTSTLSISIAPSNSFALPLLFIKPKSLANKAKEDCNETNPRVEKKTKEQILNQNLPYRVSSIVVSVMADLEEYKDGKKKEVNGLLKFFIVIFVDNQKYVVYSCILPSCGPQSHVVVQ